MTDTHPNLARLTRERWQANSEYWVKVIRERRDRYRTEVTDPALLDALPPEDVHGPADKHYGQRELLVLAPDGNLIAFGQAIGRDKP